MKVYVVGASGTFPAPGRPSAGYVVEQGETRVWCDAGPGTFMSLPFEPDLIDAVVISHQHPDHCSDLFAAYHAWTFRPEPREKVPLYAPRGVWDRVSAFIDQEPECFAYTPIWDGDRIDIGEIEVSFVEADHSVPTVASRWEAANRKLFYTADTGPAGTWREHVSGANVMLSEASYQGASDDKPFSQHLTAGEAGQIARDAGAEKLILTHIPPYLDPTVSVAEAEQAFDRPVRLAVPGTSFDV
jgi:ribonuclease BN (tRNA processing enzyme)